MRNMGDAKLRERTREVGILSLLFFFFFLGGGGGGALEERRGSSVDRARD